MRWTRRGPLRRATRLRCWGRFFPCQGRGGVTPTPRWGGGGGGGGGWGGARSDGRLKLRGADVAAPEHGAVHAGGGGCAGRGGAFGDGLLACAAGADFPAARDGVVSPLRGDGAGAGGADGSGDTLEC